MNFQVGIVGAGFGGLVAALRLKKTGRDSFIIFERGAELGGTWRDNIYPGCACDVASPLYSFADEPNMQWKRLYSSQLEILNYIKQVVSKNDLQKHLRYNSEIVEACFVQEEGHWEVKDAEGRSVTVGVLILGLGPLNRPHIPNWPGMSDFAGRQFHSSEWDTACDLHGKKVAVIGTGASAIQIIPAIAPIVQNLLIFQRTPAWVTPRMDRVFSAKEQSNWKKFPSLFLWQREKIFWLNEFLGLGFIGKDRINQIMYRYAALRIEKQVKDPETRKKLIPSYKIGCKRILKSDDYYPVFNQPHVRLITEPIERFVADGLVANGIKHKLDAVVYATGFVVADFNMKIKIIGLDGRNLVDEWSSEGPEAYLGTTVSGFPNLALILGPNTGLGHNSVVHVMESQMNYVIKYIQQLEKAGEGSYLDVIPNVQKTYNVGLQEKFKGTVWSSGCKSWYLNAAGKNTTLFPRLNVTFRRLLKHFDASSYNLVKKMKKVRQPDKSF